MEFEQYLKNKLEEYRSRDAKEQYKNSYRLLCGGLVISQTPARLGSDFAIRALEMFRDHLQNALKNPETFEFVGSGGPMTAAQYIAYHEQNLKTVIVDDFQIVGPGPVYPLAPGKIV